MIIWYSMESSHLKTRIIRIHLISFRIWGENILRTSLSCAIMDWVLLMLIEKILLWNLCVKLLNMLLSEEVRTQVSMFSCTGRHIQCIKIWKSLDRKICSFQKVKDYKQKSKILSFFSHLQLLKSQSIVNMWSNSMIK